MLVVQALFFADGGLLALGCNIINLGFFTCFVAYPLLYRPIAGSAVVRWRIIVASVLASIVGLQLGSLAVVAQTVFSQISDLPFSTFVVLMQSIHFAIGIAEGLITAAVVLFIIKARPETIFEEKVPLRWRVPTVIAIILFAGWLFSWFASAKPDGLEWSILQTHEQHK
jgi:cobalt/nickel transport system permease protein